MWLFFQFWFKTWTRPSSPGPHNLYPIWASASKYPLNPALPQVQSRQGNFLLAVTAPVSAVGRGMSRWLPSGWEQQALIQEGPINRLIRNSWGQALPRKDKSSYSSQSYRFPLKFGLEIYRGWAKGRRNREKFHGQAELLWESSREQRNSLAPVLGLFQPKGPWPHTICPRVASGISGFLTEGEQDTRPVN